MKKRLLNLAFCCLIPAIGLAGDDGAPAAASAHGKYAGLLRKIEVPADKAVYGEYRDLGKWSGSAWGKYRNLPVGYWVYVYPHWYIWARKIPAPPILQTSSAPRWAAGQATGKPDTPNAGDFPTAWAPSRKNGGGEWLLLKYAKAVDIAEVRIRETFNPGAVVKVTAVVGDREVPLWEGVDSTTTAPADFSVKPKARVRSNWLKIYLDTSRKDGWNEIDAVELIGTDKSRQWAEGAQASSSYGQ